MAYKLRKSTHKHSPLWKPQVSHLLDRERGGREKIKIGRMNK